MTGTTRASSVSTGTLFAPGRVDSPPISRISAPAAASASPCRCRRQTSDGSRSGERGCARRFSTRCQATDLGCGWKARDEDQYRQLHKLGKFDTKTSSWLLTPKAIRKFNFNKKIKAAKKLPQSSQTAMDVIYSNMPNNNE